MSHFETGHLHRSYGRIGFDGVEILHRQMTDESTTPAAIRQRAFPSPDSICVDSRLIRAGYHPMLKNGNATQSTPYTALNCRMLWYSNDASTRARASSRFKRTHGKRGIEPPLAGHTDEKRSMGYRRLSECLPAAERCGVTLGLENHWGLGRTPEGVMRIVQAISHRG